MITGPVDVTDDPGTPRRRQRKAADEDVIPGEPGDGGPDPPGQPRVTVSLQEATDSLAVEITRDHHRPPIARRVGQHGHRLIPPLRVTDLDRSLQVNGIHQDPGFPDPQDRRGRGPALPTSPPCVRQHHLQLRSIGQGESSAGPKYRPLSGRMVAGKNA